MGVFDIPAAGGRAQSVVPLWDLVGSHMIDTFAEIHPVFDGKLVWVFGIFYAPGPSMAIANLPFLQGWSCQVDAAGTTYDRTDQQLFIAQYGPEPRIHSYRIGASNDRKSADTE